jgi:hypothetical protein
VDDLAQALKVSEEGTGLGEIPDVILGETAEARVIRLPS